MSECPTLPFDEPEQAERWLPVPGYEGLYEVSDRGQVRSFYKRTQMKKPGGILALIRSSHTRAYRGVTLCGGGKRRRWLVHVLVAAAFIGPKPEGTEIRHLDGNPHNNWVMNLAYGTHAENMQDVTGHGRGWGVRTHCSNGHEFTPENTQMRKDGSGRRCLICKRAMSNRSHSRIAVRKRAAREAAQPKG